MAVTVTKRYQSKRVKLLCYVSGMDPNKLAEHMSKVHDNWVKVQMVVFSPVITAGISFELDHFDYCFLYAFPGLGTPRSEMQMVSRVRNYTSKRVYLYIHRAKRYVLPNIDLPTHPSGTFEWEKIDGPKQLIDALLETVQLKKTRDETHV